MFFFLPYPLTSIFSLPRDEITFSSDFRAHHSVVVHVFSHEHVNMCLLLECKESMVFYII